MTSSRKKIDAIYDVRRAAESKALAEKALEERPDARHRDALLSAQMTLEKKTVEAIEACHECGYVHEPGHTH